MHLAIVCESLAPEDEGGRQALALARQFAGRGHRVSLLAAASDGFVSETRVELVCRGYRRPHSARALLSYRRWARRALAQLDPDRVISFTTLFSADILIPSTGTTSGIARALRRLHAPLPVRCAALVRLLSPALLLRRVVERRALTADATRAVIADNARIEAELGRVKRLDLTRVHRLDPAPDHERIDARVAHDTRLRLARALDLDPDAPWLVFPFADARVGGIAPMMLAFKSLVDGGCDAVLLLAGPCRYTHLVWIAQLGLRGRVRFLGTPDDLDRLVAASDLLVQPTSHDPGGRAALTALARGRPVVTTDANGAAAWVEPGGGVVLRCPIDPAGLAEAIRPLLGFHQPTKLTVPGVGLSLPGRADALEALL